MGWAPCDFQEQIAEQARARVRRREGYQKLSVDQAHDVLGPINEALPATSAEAVAPSLVGLRDGTLSHVQSGEDRANELLDAALAGADEKPIVRIDTGLRGREVSSRDELRAVLREIEERVGPHVDRGAKVRLT